MFLEFIDHLKGRYRIEVYVIILLTSKYNNTPFVE